MKLKMIHKQRLYFDDWYETKENEKVSVEEVLKKYEAFRKLVKKVNREMRFQDNLY